MLYSIKKNNIDNVTALTEPVFYFGLKKNNKIPESLLMNRGLNYFEYSLKQNPKDLSAHLQRIQFVFAEPGFSESGNEDLFAALCDLFIILGSQGLPLRQRLFAYSKSKLDKNQIDLLTHHLTDNYLTSDISYLSNKCFFKKNPLELINLRNKSKPKQQEFEDILHTSDSYIENSQFDIALEYMIKHLEQNPDNKPLTIKLISLYKALGNANDFQNTYNRFANNSITSRYWDDAKQYFLKQ